MVISVLGYLIWLGSNNDRPFKPVRNPQLCGLQIKFAYPYDSIQTTANSKLEDIYLKSNPEFLSYVKNVVEDEKKGVTLVSAIAGYGKSVLIGPILKEIVKTNFSKISLKKFAERNEDYVIETSDLECLRDDSLELVLSKLPLIEWDTLESYLYYQLSKTNYLIIDDFDEIHQLTCNKILDYLTEKIIQDRDTIFHHVFVLGRPESFKRYIEQSDYHGKFKVLQLKDLKINDLGNTELMVRNYIKYRTPEVEDTLSYVKNVLNAINKFPDLSYSFTNLELKNVISQKANMFPIASLSDLDFKESMVDNLIERATEKHNRPNSILQNWEIYEQAFEEIAVKYDNLTQSGAFEVGKDDFILVSSNGSKYKFNVRMLLDRSGLIDLSPTQEEISYYSFKPIWLHQYFQEKYNSRRIEDYTQETCE
ncbi:MAG: hypothetical protein R2828_29865 [Saprospiraceae bacterium]